MRDIWHIGYSKAPRVPAHSRNWEAKKSDYSGNRQIDCRIWI